MGRKRQHNTTFEERQLVIFHHAKGKSHRKISQMLNISRTTVGDIIRRFENEDRIDSVPQSGRPRRLTQREERLVLRKVKRNPKLSAPKLAAAVLEECGKKWVLKPCEEHCEGMSSLGEELGGNRTLVR